MNEVLLDDPRKGGGDIDFSSVTYLHSGTTVGLPYTITETNKSNYSRRYFIKRKAVAKQGNV